AEQRRPGARDAGQAQLGVTPGRRDAGRAGSRPATQQERDMIEAIQVAAMDPATAGQAGMGPGSGGQMQATPYDIRDFAAALERTGGVTPQQAPAQVELTAAEPSEGTRALISAINNLNAG